MSPKSNFNKAVYDVFGLGSDPAKAESEQQPLSSDLPPSPPRAATVTTTESAPAYASSAASGTTPAPAAPVFRSARADATPFTYIAPGSVFEGSLKVKGDVEIAGDFKGILEASGKVLIHSNNVSDITASQLELISCKLTGDVHVAGMVQIDDKSSVEGNLTVQGLQCAGQIHGDVLASGHSTFTSTSRLHGNITTNTVTVERGAKIVGMLSISDDEA